MRPAPQIAGGLLGAEPEAKPSLFRMDSDFQERSGVGSLAMLGASAKDMFGSRQGAAEYLAEKSGGTLGADADGEPIVMLKDGTRYRLNDQGLDMSDIANVAGNVGAFFTPAKLLSSFGRAKNVGLAGRAGLQAAGAGATDVALQAGFDRGRIDPFRTAAATVGGGAGEVAGTALGAVVSKVGQVVRGSGSNARAAATMADKAGLNNPTPEQLATLTRGMEEVRAGADPRAILGNAEFGFNYTKGQRMSEGAAKFAQLSREEVLRQAPGANQAFLSAQTTNAAQLDDALTRIGAGFGGRPGATPAELAQGAASRVTQQADELGSRITEAYAKAGEGARAAISSDSVRSLPLRLQQAVADFAPNPATTPAAARTLDQVKAATDSILSSGQGANVRGVTLKALETQRRILNNNVNAATNNADRAAMVKIKREFDGWLDEAVDTTLVSGDPQSLAAMKEARGLRAEFARRFEGGSDSDKFIGGLLDGTRTPEELVNIALGAGQVSKTGGARFIERLRVASGNDPEVIGNLRAAHFLRLTSGNDGKALDMGQIVRNVNTTQYSNASIVKALYSPDEWAQIRRLAFSLQPLVAKGDFAKSSGSTERLVRLLLGRTAGSLPIVGEPLKAIASVRNTIQAERAVNQPLRLPSRPVPLQALGASAAREAAR